MQSTSTRSTALIAKLSCLGLLILLLAPAVQPAQAQVTGISYTLSPTGEYALFESDGFFGSDGNAALENGFFYGGEVGFGFGQYLELGGVYLLGRNFENDFSDLNDGFLTGYGGDNQAVVNTLDSLGGEGVLGGEVDLRRIGGKLRLNLASGIGREAEFLPYVTLGTGILRFDAENVEENDNIYVTGGLGFTFSLMDRFTVSLGGEVLAYRYNFARTFLGDTGVEARSTALENQGEPGIEPENFDEETVYSPVLHGSVQFYLGGREPGELSDLDRALLDQFGGGGGPALFIEPFYGRIEFNDALAFPKDQNVAGVSAGLRFGPYVGLRGFYWRATEGDDVFDGLPGNAVNFEDIAFYGGELSLRFGSQFLDRGFTPYLLVGAGYMDVLSGYNDDIPAGATAPEDGYFGIGGAGLEVPLTNALKLQGGARYLLMSNSDVADINEPDEVYGSLMYTAGLEFNLGGGDDGRTVDEILEDRAERRAAQQRDEFMTREEARAQTTRAEIDRLQARLDSLDRAARTGMMQRDAEGRREMEELRREVLALEQERRMQEVAPPADRDDAESYLSDETVTLPVPTVGEIYVRIGETTDDGQVETVYGPPTVVQGGAAGAAPRRGRQALSAEQIRSIVQQTIRSEMQARDAGDLSEVEIRALVQEAIRAEIRRSGADVSDLNMQMIENQLERQQREINRLRNELDDEVDQLRTRVARDDDAPPVIIEDEETGETTVVRGGLGGYTPTRFVPMAGYTVAGDGRFLIGVRGDYGGDAPFQSYGFRFAPEVVIGLGDGLSFDLVANALVDLNVLEPYLAGIQPYAGAGLGLTTETGLGINLLVGGQYDVGAGAVFAEYSTLDFFGYNRFLLGYQTRF